MKLDCYWLSHWMEWIVSVSVLLAVLWVLVCTTADAQKSSPLSRNTQPGNGKVGIPSTTERNKFQLSTGPKTAA